MQSASSSKQILHKHSRTWRKSIRLRAALLFHARLRQRIHHLRRRRLSLVGGRLNHTWLDK